MRAIDATSAWHTRDSLDVAAALGVDPRGGLTDEEAATRRAAVGPNELPEPPPDPWWHTLVRQFLSPLIAILVVAVLVAVLVGEVLDATIIAAIVVLNGVLGFLQEHRAEQAIAALRGLLAPSATVCRAHVVRQVPSADVVPGDVVLLEGGDLVPADVRLVETAELQVDEAVLTGESAPVGKSTTPVREGTVLAERSSMAYAGTVVTAGVGTGVVVATGPRSEFGRVSELTLSVERQPTPLQRDLARLGRRLGFLALVLAALVALVGMAAGEPATDMFLLGVSLAVAVVPEGLPAVVTITLALGVSAMARRNALLRRLESAETLGAATVICTDKTGTLTTSEMTVTAVWTPSAGSARVDVGGVGYAGEGKATVDGAPPGDTVVEEVRLLAETGAWCNRAQLERRGETWHHLGDPTEVALLTLAAKAGVGRDPAQYIVEEIPFDARSRQMSVLVDGDGLGTVHVKGAADAVLARSTLLAAGRASRPLTDADRDAVAAAVERLAGSGLRTLALARSPADVDATPDGAAADGLVLLGVVGIHDPPRPEVPAAVDTARSAGLTVIVVTGDAGPTALSIARQVGLPADRAATGDQVDVMGDAELLSVLDGRTVLARVTPEHKLRVVETLQRAGEVVAMTGDGVNDGPALKRADVGMAMGRRGTDVARAASDMVLTDDNFSSIVHAIEEGRRQYGNIRKFVGYLLSSNLGEVVAISTNLALGGPLILLPAQILWMNLLTDGVTAVTLGFERLDDDAMRRAPRPRTEAIVNRRTATWVAVVGVVIGLGALAVFRSQLGDGDDEAVLRAQTMAFTGIVLFEKVNVFNFRTERTALARVGLTSNRGLLIAWSATLLAQVAAVHLGPLQTALHTTGLGLADWLLLAGLALPLIVGGELTKAIERRRADTGAARR